VAEAATDTAFLQDHFRLVLLTGFCLVEGISSVSPGPEDGLFVNRDEVHPFTVCHPPDRIDPNEENSLRMVIWSRGRGYVRNSQLEWTSCRLFMIDFGVQLMSAVVDIVSSFNNLPYYHERRCNINNMKEDAISTTALIGWTPRSFSANWLINFLLALRSE